MKYFPATGPRAYLPKNMIIPETSGLRARSAHYLGKYIAPMTEAGFILNDSDYANNDILLSISSLLSSTA